MPGRRRTGVVAVVAAAAWATACSSGDEWPELQSPLGPQPAVEARVEAILDRMSVEEKVGQVIQADVRRVTPEDVRRYHLGSVLNGGGGFPDDDKYASVADWVALADAMYDASVDTTGGRTGVPIMWGVDAVHGHNNVMGATLFPHNVGLGAANDPDLMREIGEVTAREVRVTGHDWNFGPTVAVPRDDRWGRTYEGYSEDPEIVTHYATAMVLGLQGEPGSAVFLDEDHVIATAKHFIADGGTDGGVDQGDFVGDEDELRSIHGPPYVAALEAGVQSVMASFSSWRGVKMHANQELLTGVLKERLGFDGLLVGDWNAHGQIPGCTNGSCPEALNAGIDMYMVPDDWKELYENTLEQVRAGIVPTERLDDAVRRVLRVKVRAGLLDRGRPSSRRYAGDATELGSPAHREVARRAVRRSLVMLKNDGGVLPLDPGATVVVTGSGADDIGKQSGGWTLTWQGTGNQNSDFPGATSIWDGFRNAVAAGGGTARYSADGTFDPSDPPDVAVVVFGEDPYAEFQGDRPDVDYDRGGRPELDMMRAFRAAGVPVVSVFLTGRPLWVSPELNASDAFVVAWLPGSEGVGVADVLVSSPDGIVAYDFEGRLSFSWPRLPSQAVLNRGDEEYDPLFPYGFGLTYRDDVRLGTVSEDPGPPAAGSSPRAWFDGGPVAPWGLRIRTEGGAPVEVVTGRTATPDGTLVMVVEDRRVQEDARSARWSGGAEGTVYLDAPGTADLTREAAGGLALAFDVRVDVPASAPVRLLTVHGPVGGDTETETDVSRLLADLAVGEWGTLQVPLRCLSDAGVELDRVRVPWGLRTSGELSLAFSDVRLVEVPDEAGACP